MLDEIERRDIDHYGRRLSVVIVADRDATPDDFDGYLPADIDTWMRDQWRYVGVLLMDGDTTVESLWGVEYGSLSQVTYTLDDIVTRYPVPDMLIGLSVTSAAQPDGVIVPVDVIAGLITRARDDYHAGLEREAATWTAAVALIVATDPARMGDVVEYLGFAIATEQPESVDLIAARHAMSLGASA